MSLLPLVVAVVLFFLFRHRLTRTIEALRQGRARYITVSVITALLFASFLIVGSWSTCDDDPSFTFLNIIAIFFVAMPLLVGFVWLMDWLDERSGTIQARREAVPVESAGFNRRWLIGIFAILLLCWFPIFLAAFPGFFCYDMTVGDMPEYTQWTTGPLCDHQPVIHTLLIGFLLEMSLALTGSIDGGIVVFVAIQGVIVAGVFTFMIDQIKRATGSWFLSMASLVYLAFDPLVSLFVNCTVKDTLFSAFVILLVGLLFSKAVTEKKVSTVGFWIAMGVSALGVCLFRPNGIYAFVIAIPFIIFTMAKRPERARAVATSILVLVLSFSWFGPFASMLNVQPSPIKTYNALSIPSQQMACAVTEHARSLKITEMAMLSELDYGIVQDGKRSIQYVPRCADDARWNLLEMDVPDILTLWAALGMSYPKEYTKALIYQTEGAWNPYAVVNVYEQGIYEDRETSLFAFDWEEPAEFHSLFPALLEPLREISGGLTLQNIPLLSLLVSLPFYVWMMILLLARTIITRDRRLYAPVALLAVLTLTALMGPCALVRYYLYLIFGLPIMVTMLVVSKSPMKNPSNEQAL